MHSPHWNQRSSPGTGVGVTSSVMRCPQRLLITGHRPVLDALLGSPHTHRRDDAGARRFGAQRKVRYIGFSDTPAWKVVEAQTLARFHGWAPVAAIQISYSLAERTVEGDLIPMAREFGIGVTPWSPLAGGVLTGKYTRQTRRPRPPLEASE
jgi:aryl-alcohol dehydrogenase-like predicted oxidoreductase